MPVTCHRYKHRRRGAAAVEFALCLPLVLMIFFAAFEFSRANMLRHTADNAAYEGARRAIVPGATAAEARQLAVSFLAIVGAKDATVDVFPAAITPTTPQVTVRVSVPMNSNGFVSPLFMRDKTLVSEFTLARELYEQATVP